MMNLHEMLLVLKVEDAVYTALLESNKRVHKLKKVDRNKLMEEIAALQQIVKEKEKRLKERGMYDYAQKVVDDAFPEIPF